MKKFTTIFVPVLIVLSALTILEFVFAQVGVFSKKDLIEYTPLWKGERFPDGRPKVSDDLLERMKEVSIEEAWAVCKKHGYVNQFEGNARTAYR